MKQQISHVKQQSQHPLPSHKTENLCRQEVSSVNRTHRRAQYPAPQAFTNTHAYTVGFYFIVINMKIKAILAYGYTGIQLELGPGLALRQKVYSFIGFQQLK